MQVFYDLALGLFLQSPTSNNEITQITAKRASNNPISLQFLNNGVVTTMPTGTQFRFSGKVQYQYDDQYAVDVEPSGWTGADSGSFYNCNPGYNTSVLNNAFGYLYPTTDSNRHPDSVPLNGEISWLKPGDTLWSKTGPWLLLVFNDVSKGVEGVPTSGGPVYPAPSAIELVANKGVPGGYAPLGTDGLVPLSYLPAGAAGANNGWDSNSVSGAGTTALSQSARLHTHQIDVAAGSYTAMVQLLAGTAHPADVARIHLTMAAGSATIIVLDNNGNPLGVPFASGGVAVDGYMEALFKLGTAWVRNLQI